jgi:acyl carrier protein
MTKDEIRQRIATILTEDFKVLPAKIADDATFRGSFGLDSLDIVDFILLLQKDFGYKAKTEAYQDIQSVAMLVDFVHQNVGG